MSFTDFYTRNVGHVPEETALPRPSSPEEAMRLPHGARFIDPKGEIRTKPYEPKSKEEAEQLPDGAPFIDPQGTLRFVPKYESIGFSAQTLFDMATTDKERRKALELSYPGKVKEDTRGLYIDDDGTLRRPGRGAAAAGGFLAAAAAPTVAAGAGGLLGGLGGTALSGPGPGTVIGGITGAGVGGGLGQALNDAILQYAGVYDRTRAEATETVMGAAGAGVLGEAVGQPLGAVIPLVKGATSKAATAAPKAFRYFLGEDPERLERATRLADRGALVPPSAHMMEAPHVHNIVETFEPAFHTQDPILQANTKFYEEEAGDILTKAGATPPASLSDPEAAVPVKAAGERLLQRARDESQAADAKLAAEFEARRAALSPDEAIARNKSLQEAHEQAMRAARKMLDGIFDGIQGDVNAAMRAVEVDANSGALWQRVGNAFQAVRTAGQQRFNRLYGEIDNLAGARTVPIEDLSQAARGFLEQLPEGFEGRYPSLVRQLRDMGGVQNENGEWVREPIAPTWVQLRHLRTFARYNVNWTDLPSDVYNGAYKYFGGAIDGALEAGGDPELSVIKGMLDKTDKQYGEFIRPFHDKRIQAVMDGLKSGLPPDPQKLFDTLFPTGRSDLMAQVQQMIGPNLSSAVRAADLQDILIKSRSAVPGQIDARRFAQEVMGRHRNNMLEAVHGSAVTRRLLEQVQNIEMLEGRLDIPARNGDTMSTLISRAKETEAAVKAEAKRDPLKVLSSEMRKLEAEKQKAFGKSRAERRADPLGFLYDPTTGAAEAVDRILGSEDLMFASELRFGRDSPEFKMLQQTWLQRILQGTLQPGKQLSKYTPEAQALMFPGVTMEQLQTLADDMDFLMETRAGAKATAKSMAAMAKVEHPLSQFAGGGTLGKVVTSPAKLIPGSAFAARTALGGFYGLVRKLATSPSTLRWLAKGLGGTPEEREMTRALLWRSIARGGAIGAATAEGARQGMPTPGATMNGYRFKGGDPSQQASWEPM